MSAENGRPFHTPNPPTDTDTMTTTDTAQPTDTDRPDVFTRHAGVIHKVVSRYTSHDPAVSREDFEQAAYLQIAKVDTLALATAKGYTESCIVEIHARKGCSDLVARANYQRRAQQSEMPTDHETGESWANVAPDTTERHDTAERHDVANAIHLALDGLPERERQAVAMRYGIGGEPHDLQTIGAALGVTLERARQIIARGSERLATVPALAGLLG